MAWTYVQARLGNVVFVYEEENELGLGESGSLIILGALMEK